MSKVLINKYKLGALKNEEDSRDVRVAQFQLPLATLPAIFFTEISNLPVWNQGQMGSCVGHSHALVHEYFEKKESGNLRGFSPRFIYALCKEVDGYGGEGTQPRVAAKIQTDQGCCLEDKISNYTTLPHSEYIKITVDQATKDEAYLYRTAGYAFVNNDVTALKTALVNNGLVTVTLSVGGYAEHLMPGRIGYHRVTVYGYEDVGNDVKYYFRNSWGQGWGTQGNGYFYWSEYINDISDIMVFTDIPNHILEVSKLLKLGSKGAGVITLQKDLNSLGYLLVADGNFGPKTLTAVKAFQSSHGLVSDGIVGAKTLQAIDDAKKKL